VTKASCKTYFHSARCL